MSFRYLLVDEEWAHISWFESDVPDWSVGQEVALADNRQFAITGIVPNPDLEADFTATWTVEPA